MATAPPTRRTQEERRAQTRAKLLDATVASLREVGYAATTTREVAQRAGVSSGAMTHHFPRRSDLVVAAVAQLTEERVAAMRVAAERLPAAREARLRALLDLLWADFSGPIFAVFVKLWIAADDDEELYEQMVPLERQLARAVATFVAEVRGEFGDAEDVDARVQTLLAVLRGLSLSQTFEPRRRRSGGPQWVRIRPVLERMILAD